MKTYRQIYQQAQDLSGLSDQEIDLLIWKLICYVPKTPLRPAHQQFLEKATPFQLEVSDIYFSKGKLLFNGFTWGTGQTRILLTHGWSSRAAGFQMLIEALLTIENVQVISFDAPGNGSSESELSNLILYIESVKAVIRHYGHPEIVIGHSLGAMANIIAMQQTGITPRSMISIAPVIRLKTLFVNMMKSVNIPDLIQDRFLANFEARFERKLSDFDLNNSYSLSPELNHWIAYDESDSVVDSAILEGFLDARPSISSSDYPGAGHERLIKHPPLIEDLMKDLLTVVYER